MKYKVGDRVRIKSLDWYNENKDKIGFIRFNYANFIPEMSRYCGEILTINQIVEEYKQYLVSECAFSWTDEMIEGLVEEEIKNWADVSIPDDPFTVTYGSPSMNDSMNKNNIDNGIIILPEGYIFKDENDNEILTSKIILEKKKKEYPKTYEECCKVMGISPHNELCVESPEDYTDDYENKLFDKVNALHKLLICRDAYWKIAGEEMGLNRPWKPDYDSGVNKYGIICLNGVVQESNPTTNWERHLNKVLDFPTKEMRDAFYENFKSEIESCKELL